MQGGIGYDVRNGSHDVFPFDWEQDIKFADKHLNRSTAGYFNQLSTNGAIRPAMSAANQAAKAPVITSMV